jgi:sulfate adenylyltransferase
MRNNSFLNSLNGEKKYLIDYANLIDNLFLYQKSILNKSAVDKFFKRPYLGIPIVFPTNLNIFSYNPNANFFLNKNYIKRYIYFTNNSNYGPLKNYFNFGNKFSSDFFLKKKYLNIIKKINKFNLISREKIKKLKKKYKNICAFQTRNIPHWGHEKIIDYLLLKYDHVVINPIIGPKKKGDIRFNTLEKVYNFLIKNKYKKNVSYIPFIANMFYAGPREAIHHANMRYQLGFSSFVVGRDHAGAENCYDPDEAFNIVKKYKNNLKIEIKSILGAYYCLKCNKVLIKNTCKHNLLLNISGTNFRKCLSKKKYFKYADFKMQKFIFNLKNKLFV